MRDGTWSLEGGRRREERRQSGRETGRREEGGEKTVREGDREEGGEKTVREGDRTLVKLSACLRESSREQEGG